jgi:hypothetical protein
VIEALVKLVAKYAGLHAAGRIPEGELNSVKAALYEAKGALRTHRSRVTRAAVAAKLEAQRTGEVSR